MIRDKVGVINFSILAPIILGGNSNYPGVVIYQTRPVTEIQIFCPVYDVFVLCFTLLVVTVQVLLAN